MKRTVQFLSMALLAASLTGCGNAKTVEETTTAVETTVATTAETTEKENVTEAETTTSVETSAEESSAAAVSAQPASGDLSENLFDFQAVINGTVITFPVKMADMASLGFILPEDKAEFMINPMTFTSGHIVNPDGNKLFGGFYNLSDETIPMSDAMFTSVIFKEKNTEGLDLIFARQIAFGSTSEEVVAAYGEPTEKIDGGSGKVKRERYKYKKDGNSTKEVVELLFEDDKLTEVSMITEKE